MSEQKHIWVDGIKWWVYPGKTVTRYYQPLCPKHSMRLRPIPPREWNSRLRKYTEGPTSRAVELQCLEDGGHGITLPREYSLQERYVGDKIDAQVFEKMTFINLDDTAIPVANEELKNTDYWVKAKITDSKSGTRLIIWGGSKAKKNKAQLFVEPGLKRLSFDQNDDHPTEVFSRVEATFINNEKTVIKKQQKE